MQVADGAETGQTSKDFQSDVDKGCDGESLTVASPCTNTDGDPDGAQGWRRIEEFLQEIELAKVEENMACSRDEENNALTIGSNLV
jgi:hypothetical protein